MNKEKWADTIGMIKDKFEVFNEDVIKEEIGVDEKGEPAFEEKEFIEFLGPLGKMKLEFLVRPIVVEKKANFSRRIGAEGQVKYIFSGSEKIEKLKAYKFDDLSNDWMEIESEQFE